MKTRSTLVLLTLLGLLTINVSVRAQNNNKPKQTRIAINDAMGNTIKAYDIRTKGEGRITVDASSLKNGIYTYSIYTDGKLIDTKKMMH